MIYSWHLTMKKTIIILAAFLFSEILCAQTPADYIIRARALTESGKAEEAVRLLSEAVRIHNDSRLYCEKAEAEIATGDLSAAIADFNTANSIEQYSGEYGLAGVYARKGDAATSMYHLEIFMKSPSEKVKRKSCSILHSAELKTVPTGENSGKNHGILRLKQGSRKLNIILPSEE